MKFHVYLGMLHRSEQTLAGAYRQIASGHGAEPDIHFLCLSLAAKCDKHVGALAPMIAKYGEADSDEEPERLHADTLSETRSGPLGMLRDLQDLYLLANLVDVTWMMVKQAAQGLRDDDLLHVVNRCEGDTARQIKWIKTRMKQAAPQALIAAK
jgi:hypothetical protein